MLFDIFDVNKFGSRFLCCDWNLKYHNLQTVCFFCARVGLKAFMGQSNDKFDVGQLAVGLKAFRGQSTDKFDVGQLDFRSSSDANLELWVSIMNLNF